jgi:hypothetical protein
MKTYDPKLNTLIVGGFPITGFADGSFIRVRRNNDMWSLTVGADGEGTRTKSNDKSGQIEIELSQSSLSNQFLSNLALADELENAGVVPVLMKDGSGASIHAAEQMYVKKVPDAEYGKEATTRVWILETDNLQSYIGGN